MSVLLWVLVVVIYLLIIAVITAAHEWAHYIAARRQGVAVNSFSVGMGPVLYRRMWRGTEWRLSALPIGGYVEIDGMAPEMQDGRPVRATRGFAGLGALGKIAVLLAGPAMNLVLAIALLTVGFTRDGVPVIENGRPVVRNDRARIESVVAGSVAERVGVRDGDVIVAVNGRPLPNETVVDGQTLPGYRAVQEALATSGRKTFTVEREGQRQTVAFDWAQSSGERRTFGIRYGPETLIRDVGVGGAFAAATRTAVLAVPQVLASFGRLFQRAATLDVQGAAQSDDVGGPIRTVTFLRAALEGGQILQFAALVNLSLAFFNLLPIPGLDGGRVLLVAVQALARRPLSFEVENSINFAGFAFVMLIMLFVILSDVVRLF